MGVMKDMMIEQMDREANTCPDCLTEFEHRQSKFRTNETIVICKCGWFNHMCQECRRGIRGDDLLCLSCFSAVCERE